MSFGSFFAVYAAAPMDLQKYRFLPHPPHILHQRVGSTNFPLSVDCGSIRAQIVHQNIFPTSAQFRLFRFLPIHPILYSYFLGRQMTLASPKLCHR